MPEGFSYLDKTKTYMTLCMPSNVLSPSSFYGIGTGTDMSSHFLEFFICGDSLDQSHQRADGALRLIKAIFSYSSKRR